MLSFTPLRASIHSARVTGLAFFVCLSACTPTLSNETSIEDGSEEKVSVTLPPVPTGEHEVSPRTISDTLLLRSDQELYTPGPGAQYSVKVTFTNESRRSISLPMCWPGQPKFELYKLVEKQWLLAYIPFCPDMEMDPVIVEPHASFRSEYSVPLSAQTEGFQVRSVPGIYRMEWMVNTTTMDGLSEVTSNTFVLSAP